MEDSKKEKQYPKYHNYSFYVFIVIFALAFFLGRAIFTDGVNYFYGDVWVYSLISIVIGYVLTTILYEIGKLIFGKIAGYRLVYISILFFKVKRIENGKLKFCLGEVENFGGKTLMVKKDEHYSKGAASLYLLGGTIFVVLLSAIGLIIAPIIAKQNDSYAYLYCYYLICSIALLIIIVNVAPFLSDMFTDGFALRLCLFSEENMKAYHQNLLQEEALYTGHTSLRLFEYDDYHNLLTIKGLLYNYYYYIDLGDKINAEKMVDLAIEHKDFMLSEDIGRMYSFKFFFMLLRGEYERVETEFWELPKPIRKAANNYHDHECLKTCLLITAFIDLNYDLYEYITTRLDKSSEHYYPLRQDKEDDLIDEALIYIQEHKKEWFRNNSEDDIEE